MQQRASLSLEAFPAGLVWRGDSLARSAGQGWSTGFPQLDAELPGGGWPRGMVIELLCEQPGIGEIKLLQPFLRRTAAGRWMLWVAPPWLPYAPALASLDLPLSRLLLIEPIDRHTLLWSTRLALSSGACHAVLAWPDRVDTAALRRLQLAAESSGTPLFLFRPLEAALQPSPASLRLQLGPAPDELLVTILKRRGATASGPIRLPLPRSTPKPPVAPTCHVVDSASSARPSASGLHPWPG